MPLARVVRLNNIASAAHQVSPVDGIGLGESAIYATQWPNNEPAGMTPIVFFDGTDKSPGSPAFEGPGWQDNGRVLANVSDAGSRYGTVIEKRFFVGDPSDWNGLIQYSFSTVRHVYARWIVKYSSNYQINSGNEKMFYLGGPGGDGADVYVRINSGSAALFLTNELNGAGFNDINLGDVMERDVYDAYELHYVAESSAAAGDGEYHIWKNGVLLVSATGQNWGSGTPGWNLLSMYDFWGGGGDTKSVNDNVRISEFYLSGKN